MSQSFNRRTPRTVLPILALLATLGAASVACQSHDTSDLIMASEVSTETPMAPATSCDLGADASSFAAATPTRLLAGELPAIQPPCGIAIARVACTDREPNRALQVEPIAPERAAFWNQLVADLPGVREVSVLRTLGMDPRGIAMTDLLREARNQDCSYLLVFRIVEPDAASAIIQAVLWSVEPAHAVVAFNSDIRLPEAVIQKCSDSDTRMLRECDPSYQVEGELRLLVRDTLWDMAARSRPEDSPTTRPNPWKTDQPILPRDEYRFRQFMRSGL